MAELQASTPDAGRTPGTTDTPGAVAIGEAVELWEVSPRTLRRKLADGIHGAYKITGPKGEEWRIPAAALDALGYPRRSDHAPPVVEPTSGELAAIRAREDTQRTLDALLATMAASRGELMAAEADRKATEVLARDALAETARLEERLKAANADTERERERADALAAELDAARKPRRRWGRGA
jgi:hypothetical protein